jgi:hypothetical protein
MSGTNTEDGEILLATHKRGNLKVDQLNERIEQIWSETMATPTGRQEIAAALGVKPEALKQGEPPIAIDAAAGAGITELMAIGQWALIHLVAPALIGLAQDEVKKRLARLWTDVLLPAIRGDDEGAIGK